MKKNKILYYWLGGLAVLALVVGVAVYSQGEQFQGMIRLNKSATSVSKSVVSAPAVTTVVQPVATFQQPTPLSPAKGAVLDSEAVKTAGGVNFTWSSVPSAVKYDLRISTPTSADQVYTVTGGATSYFVPVSQLNLDSYYSGCVVAYDANGKGAPVTDPSKYYNLTIVTQPPAWPTLIAPADQATLKVSDINSAGGVTFQWSSVPKAVRYDLYVGNDKYPAGAATNFVVPASKFNVSQYTNMMWYVMPYDAEERTHKDVPHLFLFHVTP